MKDRGFYDKFTVTRTDGQSAPGGKHEHCIYFVLDVYCDPHAEKALAAYAESCRATHPALAADIDKMLDRCKQRRDVAQKTIERLARMPETLEKLRHRIENETPQDWTDGPIPIDPEHYM